MKKIASYFMRSMIQHNIGIFLLLVGVSFFFGFYTLHLQIKTDNEVLLNKTSQVYQNYQDFTENFKSDRLIFLLFEGELLEKENLEKIKFLTDSIQEKQGVEEIISVTNIEAFKAKLFSLEIEPAYLSWDQKNTKNKESLKKSLLSNVLFKENLVSKDWQRMLGLIYLESNISEETRNAFVTFLLEEVKKCQEENIKIDILGIPVEEFHFLTTIKQDQKELIPFIFIVLLIACVVFMRGIIAPLASAFSIIVTLVWTMGTVSFTGTAINPITSLLSPVVMIISLAHIIHIMGYLSTAPQINRQNVDSIITKNFENIGAPAFMAAFTTSLGFIALLVNPNPAIQQFGRFAAIASMYSYIISFIVATFIIRNLGTRYPLVGFRFIDKILNLVSGFVLKNSEVIVILALLIIGGIAWGGRYLRIDTRLSSYLKNESSMSREREILDRYFKGSSSLEIVIKSKERDYFNSNLLKKVSIFRERIYQIKHIKQVNSFDLFVINIFRLFEEDPNGFPDDSFLNRVQKDIKKDNNELNRFVSADGKQIRLNCLLLDCSTKDILTVKKNIEEILSDMFSDGFESYVTGREFLFAEMSESLVFQQRKSILLAGVFIGILIFVSMHSPSYSILAFLAMIFPVIMLQGFMGWVRLPLNTATVMISSVVMGLLVDDTIHFLYSFREKYKNNHKNIQNALQQTIQATGAAIFLTSFILIIGFSVGLKGNVVPTVQFSLLLGVASFFGVMINLILMPTILKGLGRRRKFK